MLDSLENLYMMEMNFIVKPAIPCRGGRCLRRRMNEVFQTMVTRLNMKEP
jgi:hypothetical protein